MPDDSGKNGDSDREAPAVHRPPPGTWLRVDPRGSQALVVEQRGDRCAIGRASTPRAERPPVPIPFTDRTLHSPFFVMLMANANISLRDRSSIVRAITHYSFIRFLMVAGVLWSLSGCATATKYIEPATDVSNAATVVGYKPGLLRSLDPLGTKAEICFTSIDGVALATEAPEIAIRPGVRRIGVVAHLIHDNVFWEDVHGEVIYEFVACEHYKVVMGFGEGTSDFSVEKVE